MDMTALGSSRQRPLLKLACLSLAPCLMVGLAGAQTQIENIVGDTPEPDSNNWLYPVGPQGNKFLRPNDSDFGFTVRKAMLGKMLFWDEQLSSDNTMSCGTCHFPSTGGADPREGALGLSGHNGALGMCPQDKYQDYGGDPLTGAPGGAQTGQPFNAAVRRRTHRNPPTMIGSAFFFQVNWDLSAGPALLDEMGNIVPGFSQFAALEQLSTIPPESAIEMAHDDRSWANNTIQDKLNEAFPLRLATPNTVPADLQDMVFSGATYKELMDEVFQAQGGATRTRIVSCIAHYIRTLTPNKAPIDLGAGGESALTEEMKIGFDLMNSSNCFKCHSATNEVNIDEGFILNPHDQLLSDGHAHFINLPDEGGDDGIDDTVKTPTLRNVGLRKKFFHTGQFTDFDSILAFYNAEIGAAFNRFTSGSMPDGTLTDQEKDFVKIFLVEALTDPRVAAETFPFDRPDLYSERVPFEDNLFCAGHPDDIGRVPNMIANNPAFAVTQEFKVGLAGTWGNTYGELRLTFDPFQAMSCLFGNEDFNFPIVTDQDGHATVFFPINDPGLIGVSFGGFWKVAGVQGAPGSSATRNAIWTVQ